jgi:hypothetical protein
MTRHLDEQYDNDYLRPTFRKLASTIIQGAIGYGYKSELVFWDHKA